ncbi:MAG TPA: ABC transporter permease [Candidatus Saccharimonadales bacterium]|nr:ABC transporter permease [Candidatus Saccharimonadales bacterium]
MTKSSLTRGHFKAGLDAVRGAKLRSFWTMFGVIVGVTSVITVLGIGQGVNRQVTGQIHHLGNDLITIRPAQLHPGGDGGNGNVSLLSDSSGFSGALRPRDISTVAGVKGVAASAPLTVVTGKVTGDQGDYNQGFVIGTGSDLSALLNQSVSYGSFLTSDDDGTNAAVLGPHAAEALFNEDVPLGRSFTFRGQRFIVRGVFNNFTTTPLSQETDFNNAIFIPNEVAESLTNSTAPTYEILAKASNAKQTNQVAAAIQKALDKSRGGQSNLAVLRGNQNVTASQDILQLLTRLVAGVAAISLFVGGVGIMNVMLVSVSERTHEIGIRKAVGATNSQILSQFMIEATALSVIGGAIGVALAFVIDGLLRLFTDLRPVISWQAVVLAFGVSLVVGVVFGTIPALKAARRDPIEALRSE